MRRAAAIVLASALALSACDQPAVTEIVLVVDTDIAAADRLVVTATYPDGEAASSADLAVQPPPRTLVLVHRTGPLGPVHLRIAALESGAELAHVEREVSFEADRSLTLSVFLAAACVGVDCGAGETCGDDGACRDAFVRPCEYDGRSCGDADSGVDGTDATLGDAGGCGLTGAICGLPDTLLPGDRVTPVACDGGPAATVSVTGPTAELTPDGDAFLLVEPGAHLVRLADGPGCAIERTVQVAGPYVVPNDGVAPGVLRDMDARVGAAFVAGDNGAWAVDRTRWVDLRAAGATGDVAVADLGSVVVHAGQPVFGPVGNEGAVFRVVVDDLDGSFLHERVGIVSGGGDRSVHDMAVALYGGGTVAIATKDGLVGLDFPPVGAPRDVAIGSYEASWIAVGAERWPSRGEVWMGRTGEIANRRLDTGPEFDAGQPNGAPDDLVELHGAVVDDRDPSAPRLWLCGDGGVALYRLDAHDWSSLTELPVPDAEWTELPCVHLAVGPDGHAWVATGGNRLARLGPDAAEILRYGSVQSLSTRTQIARVAVAWDDARREVWILDAVAGEVLLFVADAVPAG